MSVVDELMKQVLSPEGLSTLSQQSGLDANTVRHIAGAGLPAILQGVMQNAGGQNQRGLAQALNDHGHAYNQRGYNAYDVMKHADLNDGSKILGHVLGGRNNEVEDYLAQKTGATKKQTNSILSTLAPLALAVLGGKFVADGGLDKIFGPKDQPSTPTAAMSEPAQPENKGLLGEVISQAGALFGGGNSQQQSSGGLVGNLMGMLGGSNDTSGGIAGIAKNTLAKDENNNGIPDILEGVTNLIK